MLRRFISGSFLSLAVLLLASSFLLAQEKPVLDNTRAATFISGGDGSNWDIFDSRITSNGLPTGGTCNNGVDGSGVSIFDATIPAGGDAFDDAGLVFVDDTQLGGELSVSGNRVTFDPQVLSGLNVQSIMDVLTTEATLRHYVTFENPTASAITIDLDYVSNFGSDNNTTIDGSFSGDATFTPADTWVVTSDGSDVDAVNTTVFGDAGTQVPLTAASTTVFSCSLTQGLQASFSLTIPAGATSAMVFFHRLSDTTANALAAAPDFDDVSPGSPLLDGLSAAELAAIVNLGLTQGQLFFSEDDNSTGLYQLDITTGAATNLGDTGVNASTVGLSPSSTPGVLFGSQPFALLEIQADGSGAAAIGGDVQEGLAFDASTGTLYGAINNQFRTIDPATGSNSATLAAPGGDVEGIAFGNGGVYGIISGSVVTDLLFYDPGTDSWTTIGSTGITWDQAGLAYDPGTDTLYAKGDQDSNLYSIDPATGAATLIGDTGIANGGGLAFAFISQIDADLAVSKTGATTAIAGTQATYTIEVTNNGPGLADNVEVNDTPPAGFSFASATAPCTGGFPCALGTVANGGTVSFDVTFDIAADTTPGDFTNTAAVTTTTTDPDAGNNSADATTTVSAEADLAISKTGAATAVAGTQATYTIQVSNSGPSDAQGVSVTDTPPAGFSFASATAPCTGGFPCALGTVAAGDSVSFDVTFDIAADTTPGDFTNTAAVTTTTTDPDTGNNSADATTAVSAEADLAITKTGAATAVAGTQATYTIQVTNSGPSDAQAVSVTDTPPAGFSFASVTAPCIGGFPCALGTVAAGASVSFDVTFDIAADVTGEVTNTAAVTTSTTDPDTGNNSAAAITSMGAEADLSILKVGDVTAPLVGGQTTYIIEVSNAGPSVATGVVITDNLPTGQTLVSSTGCAEDPAGAPTCTVGTLAPGASATVTLTVSLDGSGGAEQTNTASVASAATDPNSANNTDSAVIFVIFPVPTLSLPGLALLMLALLTLGLVTVRRMN